MSFQYMVPGYEPTSHGHESPPITTRPGLFLSHTNPLLNSLSLSLYNVNLYIPSLLWSLPSSRFFLFLSPSLSPSLYSRSLPLNLLLVLAYTLTLPLFLSFPLSAFLSLSLLLLFSLTCSMSKAHISRVPPTQFFVAKIVFHSSAEVVSTTTKTTKLQKVLSHFIIILSTAADVCLSIVLFR